MNIRCSEVILAGFLALGLAAPASPQTIPRKDAKPAQPGNSTERQRAIQALNRLTFGPKPGDVDAVLRKGVDEWIEDQLHP